MKLLNFGISVQCVCEHVFEKDRLDIETLSDVFLLCCVAFMAVSSLLGHLMAKPGRSEVVWQLQSTPPPLPSVSGGQETLHLPWKKTNKQPLHMQQWIRF